MPRIEFIIHVVRVNKLTRFETLTQISCIDQNHLIIQTKIILRVEKINCLEFYQNSVTRKNQSSCNFNFIFTHSFFAARLAVRSNLTMKSSQILFVEGLNKHCLKLCRLLQFYTHFCSQNNVTTTRSEQVYVCECCANDLLVGRHEMR